jgi:hypothetical protein
MPRGDGTGPRGMGAGTGRGLGACKAGDAGITRDRGAGFPGRAVDSEPGPGGRMTGGRSKIGKTVLDGLFSWLERISRK